MAANARDGQDGQRDSSVNTHGDLDSNMSMFANLGGSALDVASYKLVGDFKTVAGWLLLHRTIGTPMDDLNTLMR